MSEPNTGGAVILVEPAQMSQPTYLPLQSTGEKIVLELTELTTYEDIGGSPIDSYLVQMSVGDTGTWSTL